MSELSTDAVPRFVPDWPTCRFGDGSCTGRQIDDFEHCLAHLLGDDLDAFLDSVRPGSNFDLRGTSLATDLLQRLLSRTAASPGAADSPIHVGEADFRFCNFLGQAGFGNVRFVGQVRFSGARFDGITEFSGARFAEQAVFGGAQFAEQAVFGGAQFAERTEFGRAQFAGDAEFGGVRFAGRAGFGAVRLEARAVFSDVLFAGDAVFDGAQFAREAGFDGARFAGEAWFVATRFAGAAVFSDVQFAGEAGFVAVRFEGWAWFSKARFGQRVEFSGAQFAENDFVGPLVADQVDMSRASFAKRVVVEVVTGALLAVDARFEEGVELRVRYARVSLRRVFFGGPSSLSGAAEPFAQMADDTQVVAGQHERAVGLASTAADPAAGHGGADFGRWVPRLVSVQETDVSQLTVADVDLRWCRFAGAHQLDKLRLEGRSPFNRPPRGWRVGWAWLPVWRWSPRRALAEEHQWRARRRKSGGWTTNIPSGSPTSSGFGRASVRGTTSSSTTCTPLRTGPPSSCPGPVSLDNDDSAARIVGPEQLAVLYRSLRKAFEDAKNEAGAGDFYYGEMDARRHASTTGRGEHFSLYWMISGYGQRAGRALAALVFLIGVLFALLTQFGLPASTAVQQMTATVPAATAGHDQEITIDVEPVAPTLSPQDQRWTADRMDKAIRIAMGSVVFRDSGTPLTRTGTWTIMAGRALGPLLLALTALAIRARVKR